MQLSELKTSGMAKQRNQQSTTECCIARRNRIHIDHRTREQSEASRRSLLCVRVCLVCRLRLRLVSLLGRLTDGYCGRGRNGRFALLGGWLRDDLVHWGLDDLDGIGKRLLWAELTLGIPALHAR